MNIELPKAYPVALLLALGLFTTQPIAKYFMMQRQAKIMARKSFMSDFQDDHVIAFDNEFGKSADTCTPKSSSHSLQQYD